MGQHTVPIWMKAHLQYLLITVKVIPLEKASFSDTQNSKAGCQLIDSQWQTLSA